MEDKQQNDPVCALRCFIINRYQRGNDNRIDSALNSEQSFSINNQPQPQDMELNFKHR